MEEESLFVAERFNAITCEGILTELMTSIAIFIVRNCKDWRTWLVFTISLFCTGNFWMFKFYLTFFVLYFANGWMKTEAQVLNFQLVSQYDFCPMSW